ncbi:MAG TPA: fumarylacetoacetate hydrolase family protein [Longimicrobiales bacterium]|nr:fumarylacetoacetate hydrolase family protein [Longimicrobiales bacterium]
MTRWIRFEHDGRAKFGTLVDGQIRVHEGDMFDGPTPTVDTVSLDSVRILPPCMPTKIIGLWNNFAEAAAKNGLTRPQEPLYFFKPSSGVLRPGGTILQPESYGGRVFFEGELGVVIGKRCRDVSAADVADCVFGYTCVNDATAFEIISEDPSFAQWSRAKSFDTLTPIGPVIATGLDPQSLRVSVRMNGKVRQEYPVSDMFFSPLELVERISRGMTLLPGDLITCGTSLGARPMKPGSTVEVDIDGIGVLSNTFASGAE